jgi:hypothetical protein
MSYDVFVNINRVSRDLIFEFINRVSRGLMFKIQCSNFSRGNFSASNVKLIGL